LTMSCPRFSSNWNKFFPRWGASAVTGGHPKGWLSAVGVVLVGFLMLELAGVGLARRTTRGMVEGSLPPAAGEEGIRILERKNAALEKKIAAMAPKGPYLAVDTAGNLVFLRQGQETRRECVASCGSGNVLEDPGAGRKWIFDTPRGEFNIQSKVVNPLWIKPDWAFIEEGLPVPTRQSARAETGMMGDYALGIGCGYFIHGTLYKRMLGRNVTHGCVRLGDEDLKSLHDTVPIGTKVFIF